MSEQPQLFETEDQYGNDIIQGPKLLKKIKNQILIIGNTLILLIETHIQIMKKDHICFGQ